MAAEWGTNGGHYTPTQAAHILRLTPTRVRQLLQNGELEGKRDGAGHWTIPSQVVHERLERLRRESFLEAVGYDPSSGPEMRERVEELRGQVDYLRGQLEAERQAHAEARRIIAGLVEGLSPGIKPPQEQAWAGPSGARMSPETAAEGPGDAWDTWQEEPKEPSDRSEPRESPVSPGPNATPQPPGEEAHGVAERPWTEEEGTEDRRSWWRRFFGFGG